MSLPHILLRNRYDVVVGHEEGGFLAVSAAFFFRVPVVYEMHSSLPRQIIEWEFSRSPIVLWLFRFVERSSIRRSAAVVAISHQLSAIAHEAAPRGRIATIPNVYERHAFPTTFQLTALREELALTRDQRIILYTGSFVSMQALDLLLLSVPNVIRDVPNAYFVLVGGEEREIKRLRGFVNHLNLVSYVRLVPQRPYHEMPIFEALSDVVVSPRIRGINPPGKLAAYLQSGRPIVATNCAVHEQLLDKPEAILTQPDPISLAQGIIAALNRKSSIHPTCHPIWNDTSSSKEFEQIQGAYNTLLRSVVSSRGALFHPQTLREKRI